jgi:hypothetical protein
MDSSSPKSQVSTKTGQLQSLAKADVAAVENEERKRQAIGTHKMFRRFFNGLLVYL